MKKADKKVTVGMSQELYDAMKRLAQEDCRSVPSCIRLILREHLQKRNGEGTSVPPQGTGAIR